MFALTRSSLLLLLLLSCPYLSRLHANQFSHEFLPDEIAKDLDKLMVDRKGTDPESFMLTQSIVGFVRPGACYRIQQEGLATCDCSSLTLDKAKIEIPKNLEFFAVWHEQESEAISHANILGGLGTFWVTTSTLRIPIAETKFETLAYYGASLLAMQDTIEFESDAALPVAKMTIGEKYVEGFLMEATLGGGAYLEYHDRPHFHMPASPNARGYLILGKKVGDDFQLSAFQIPFGFAVYTPPNVIHSDSFLIGDYFVVYSVTKNFSTAIIRSESELKSDSLVKLVFVK